MRLCVHVYTMLVAGWSPVSEIVQYLLQFLTSVRANGLHLADDGPGYCGYITSGVQIG